MNKVQELMFDLMKEASFNDFDGDQVVRDLTKHQDLWRGAVMLGDRLMCLRDIAGGEWHADVLYILPVLGKEDALRNLARTWKADTIEWIRGELAEKLLGEWSTDIHSNWRAILRLWWD